MTLQLKMVGFMFEDLKKSLGFYHRLGSSILEERRSSLKLRLERGSRVEQ